MASSSSSSKTGGGGGDEELVRVDFQIFGRVQGIYAKKISQ
jgi:hypothetical protein